MRLRDDVFNVEPLPAPTRWRASLFWSLVLTSLWAGLLLPWMPQQQAATNAERRASDPFAVVFKDGRRLVCEGCRSITTLLQCYSSPAALAIQDIRTALPGRPPASTAPAPAKLLTQSMGAMRHSVSSGFGATRFSEDVRQSLPRYRSDFEKAARRNGLDWRLLAAVGYQESHWNAVAESPTGVRGLMMLTSGTALELGVDRTDGAQSIAGAGRLLRSLYDQLPQEILEPDRTAMALAAYNQGLGHLLDARDVTVNLGGNPDRWSDVRKAMPLLSDAEWQKTTKYGHARGDEAVAFVDRVYLYYSRLASISAVSAEIGTDQVRANPDHRIVKLKYMAPQLRYWPGFGWEVAASTVRLKLRAASEGSASQLSALPHHTVTSIL